MRLQQNVLHVYDSSSASLISFSEAKFKVKFTRAQLGRLQVAVCMPPSSVCFTENNIILLFFVGGPQVPDFIVDSIQIVVFLMVMHYATGQPAFSSAANGI